MDTDGNFWVGRRTGDLRVVVDYDIFDPRGRWISSLTIPPDLERICEIGTEHILGIWRDEFDVSYLRLYRISKPEGRR